MFKVHIYTGLLVLFVAFLLFALIYSIIYFDIRIIDTTNYNVGEAMVEKLEEFRIKMFGEFH